LCCGLMTGGFFAIETSFTSGSPIEHSEYG